ncbi:hypothetical protein Tsubulata_023281 [Turnera subulata]|uniref:F-box domain-containing protein n=1 Tax=Turnera subulata TaxID=218843 RepID=A0A9Q0JBJ4_9ROSI|nr:hypothetical protein Tsubulata_023281 [Turnera subulata]
MFDTLVMHDIKQQQVGADPVGEASKIFSQQEGCSRTVTSQYQFVNRTTESEINTKATPNHYQKRARSGEEHEELQLLKKRKGVILQENMELKSPGFPLNTPSHEERFQSTPVETKREHLKKTEQQCRMVLTMAQLDEDGTIISELFPLKDFKRRVYAGEGMVALVGSVDPLVLWEELKDIYGVDLLSFTVLPVNKHMEKDGWHCYCTKKKLERVLENLHHQNGLLEAEMERAKCRLGSNQHVPQGCGKMERKPDISVILPIDCIAHIISFTSPMDACQLSLVCHAFCAAAGMDDVWDRFLPSDYDDNILHANSFSSAKEKFFSLCRKTVFLDDCTMSFVDRQTGKKCLMLWNARYKIRGSTRGMLLATRYEFESKLLSPKTAYVVYYVFDLEEITFSVDLLRLELHVELEGYGLRHVLLEPPEEMDVVPRERPDGSKEVAMGEFFNGEDGARVKWWLGLSGDLRLVVHGFITKGIEFRPKVADYS